MMHLSAPRSHGPKKRAKARSRSRPTRVSLPLQARSLRPTRLIPFDLPVPLFLLILLLQKTLRKNTTHTNKPVLGLELLLALLVVVDQAETLGRAATELGLEAKDDDALGLGLVERGELLGELGARDVGAGGVEDSQDKLLAVEQAVRDELGRAEGDGASGVLFGLVYLFWVIGDFGSISRYIDRLFGVGVYPVEKWVFSSRANEFGC